MTEQPSDDLTILNYEPQLLSDLRMLYQSVKSGWNVDDKVKKVALRRLAEILTDKNRPSTNREYLAAARVLAMFDRSDMERIESIMKMIDPDHGKSPLILNQQNNVTINNHGNMGSDIQEILEQADAEGYGDELRKLAEREGVAGFSRASEIEKEPPPTE